MKVENLDDFVCEIVRLRDNGKQASKIRAREYSSHSGDPPAGGSGLGSTGASELATCPFSACNRGSVNALSVTPCSSAKVRRLPLRCNSQRRNQFGSEEKSSRPCCSCSPLAVTVTRLACPPSEEKPNMSTRCCQLMRLGPWVSVAPPSSPSSEELSSSSSQISVLHKGQVADLSASHLPMHLKYRK